MRSASATLLPPFAQTLTLANPIVYMVSAFRHGLLGSSGIHLGISYAVMLSFTIALVWLALHLLRKGVGLRS